MKKVLMLMVTVGLAVALLSGCTQGTMMYEGKEQNVTDVEEMISDKLEVDNPSLDLEVNIMEESD